MGVTQIERYKCDRCSEFSEMCSGKTLPREGWGAVVFERGYKRHGNVSDTDRRVLCPDCYEEVFEFVEPTGFDRYAGGE